MESAVERAAAALLARMSPVSDAQLEAVVEGRSWRPEEGPRFQFSVSRPVG
ncbi:hypothetical protein ACFWPX_30170 [Nocardia sp. NPDC058518]|uniref:hypothetical protein n=1 Tax=Nocardia sp. NPDC058518 TaxID=3346534 RepID=UPI003648936A